MTIDPGLTGTGCALFQTPAFYSTDAGVQAASLDPEKALDLYSTAQEWTQRATDIGLRQCSNILRKYDVVEVLIEYPRYFNSPVGDMAARRGDINKLVYLIGLISGQAVLIGEAKGIKTEVKLIDVLTWKGQLSKKMVIERIKEMQPELASPKFKKLQHAWDAIGIGLWAQGRFK